ncbi:MAG: pyridoxamine 5'-phosphate oxidase family protein [Pseudomonadota bacterium]
MSVQFPEIRKSHRALIDRVPVFFVATAAPDGRVNLSPKGRDSLKVLGPNRIIWLNYTGSGNETAGHLLQHPRMTLMWCAFDGDPMILRAFGTARAVHPGDPDWDDLSSQFSPDPATRQIFDLKVEMVRASCGTAVPVMSYVEDRTELAEWSAAKSPEELIAYRNKKNLQTIDGFPTGLKQIVP